MPTYELAPVPARPGAFARRRTVVACDPRDRRARPRAPERDRAAARARTGGTPSWIDRRARRRSASGSGSSRAREYRLRRRPGSSPRSCSGSSRRSIGGRRTPRQRRRASSPSELAEAERRAERRAASTLAIRLALHPAATSSARRSIRARRHDLEARRMTCSLHRPDLRQPLFVHVLGATRALRRGVLAAIRRRSASHRLNARSAQHRHSGRLWCSPSCASAATTGGLLVGHEATRRAHAEPADSDIAQSPPPDAPARSPDGWQSGTATGGGRRSRI